MKCIYYFFLITLLVIFPLSAFSQKVTSWTGTGFALNEGYVVTNYHVIDGATYISVLGTDPSNFNKIIEAEVVATDKFNDLAIIRLKGVRPIGIPYSIKTSMAEVGENAWVLGYPLTETMGNEIKLTTGIISARSGIDGNKAQYQISVPVQPGNSGGPLFDENGNVIGVVCAHHKGAELVSYAIKASYIRNLMECEFDHNILPQTNIMAGKKLSERVKMTKNYVYYIICSLSTSNINSSSKPKVKRELRKYVTFYPTLDYVDLGLPSGTLWATCNLGASSPEQIGYKYAWGETVPTGNFSDGGFEDKSNLRNYQFSGETSYLKVYTGDWSTYKWGSIQKFDKYLKDELTELDIKDDPAGSYLSTVTGWRSPTREQIKELIDARNTTISNHTFNGVDGFVVVSKTNGKSIFIPMEKKRSGALLWSSSLYLDSYSENASCLLLSDREKVCGSMTRYTPNPIRPVRSKVGTPFVPQYIEPDYVDLGLPSGTLWATCNLGATSPEETGYYFTWGETIPCDAQNSHNLNNITYNLSKGDSLYFEWKLWVDIHTYQWRDSTKYSKNVAKNLESIDDAATANLGAKWKMPSKEQLSELIDTRYTYNSYIYYKGVRVRKITSKKNGNSIFLPVTGYRAYQWIGLPTSGQYLATSSNRSLFFNENKIYVREDSPGWGNCIRPVRNK